jgi:hypothetical protein
VHQRIQNETSDAVERDEEILERVFGNPKAATVVAEEVVDQGDKLGEGVTWVLFKPFLESLSMYIEPWICATCKSLNFCPR